MSFLAPPAFISSLIFPSNIPTGECSVAYLKAFAGVLKNGTNHLTKGVLANLCVSF